jgi:AcrR family transcriptional regulator
LGRTTWEGRVATKWRFLLRLSASLRGVIERPLRSDAARNRERVMQAARELFAERGLDVTMDEIARHAGVGVGTAYRRFENREALVEALFDDRIADYVALAETALADPDPWNGLVAFLETSVAMQAADRGLKDLLLGQAHTLERMARVREQMLPRLEELIGRAHAAGVLRPDVGVLDLPLLSLMLGRVIDLGEPDLWRRYLPLLLDGLRAGTAPRSELPVPALDREQLDAALACLRPR